MPIRHPDPRFYSTRNRVSTILLLFVVVFGLPLIGIPSLRQRLSTRVMSLKTAFSGEIVPATLVAGSNHEPFPAEFERPTPPPPQHAPVVANLDRVFTLDGRPASPSPSPAPMAVSPRSAKSAKTAAAAEPAPASAAAAPVETQAAAQPAAGGEDELKYQRGKAEQEAYDLLLKLNPAVNNLIQGKDPSLKFKSWDAVNRGDEVYWVRLRFQAEGTPDAEYIWQVKVQSSQATPLNYNARNLGQ